VCRAYAMNDPRVRYFRNEHNLRYAGNQNAAVSRARGEFIAFVHDGDIYHPDMVTKWVESLRAYPTAGLVFNARREMEEHGHRARTIAHNYPPLINGHQLGSEMLDRNDSPIFGIIMTRATALRQAGAFNEMYPVLADVDMWLRILLNHDAAYVADPLFDVMPRETGHINKRINWSIVAEFDSIHMVNAARYDAAAPQAGLNRSAAVLRRLRRKNLYLSLHCAAKGNFIYAARGVLGMLSGSPVGLMHVG